MKVELLAPAGSYESFLANLEAGADAVYIGGKMFGARAYAQNFTQEEILRAIDEAHIRNRKLYLTVNTLMKQEEMEQMLYGYLAPLYEQGLDAVIVQDMGAIRRIRTLFPDMAIHVSTQATVTGPESAAFMEREGAARVVTARELSLDEIRAIRENCNLEIESFVHGALCYSYSGQCLFSSILGGRSGNRGRCAQPCRLPYQVQGTAGRKQGELYPLSPKDMCTIDMLPEIIEAGVNSLKIEGRMKQASYTAGVVGIYRKYLDLYLENGHYKVTEDDRNTLLSLFNRGGFHTGYYVTHNGPKMMAFSNEKKVGEVAHDFPKMKEKVKGNLILSPGKHAILRLSYGIWEITEEGSVVQAAMKQPLDEGRIRRQMYKTGNLPYEFEKLSIEIDGDIFLPMGELNALRRGAFEQLMQQICQERRRESAVFTPSECLTGRAADRETAIYTASCETMDQAQKLLVAPYIQEIYCPVDIFQSLSDRAKTADKKLHLALPHVMRGEGQSYMEQVIQLAVEYEDACLLVRNLEEFAILERAGLAKRCRLDSHLYVWNREAGEFWKEHQVAGVTLPWELNARELAKIAGTDMELCIYGYIPMMISAQCVRKNLKKCNRQKGHEILTDRYHTNFTVKCYCDHCYNVIYNSLPYGLSGAMKQVRSLGVSRMRLSFTIENGEQTAEVLALFDEHKKSDPRIDFTKGHFKRGVE